MNTFFIDSNENKFSVLNTQVLEQVKLIHQDPDTDYGHRKMTSALKIQGYQINHKKVYRLMRKADLLKEKHVKRM